MGGHVLQYQVRVNPFALQKYDLTMADVAVAIQANNRNVGGQFIVLGAEEYLVRGLGLVEQLDQLRDIQLDVAEGVPVRIRDVAEVAYGNAIRRGVVSLNGEREVVCGIVMKLYGENTSAVIDRLRATFPEIQEALPDGVRIVPYYNQARLVSRATHTMTSALLEGAALVVLVLLLFLGRPRTALIVALSVPFCALVAVLLMSRTGLSANLMSLGGIAIAIGMLGDGTIVMIENIHRHLTRSEGDRNATILRAVAEVDRPILFSVLIIIVVFLPLLTLQSVEGKMFAPMASTIVYALVGSLAAALVMAPVLASYLHGTGGRGGPAEPRLVRGLKRLYRPLLERCIRRRGVVLSVAILALAATLLLVPRLGTEFIPVLEEGSIQVLMTFPPSTSLEKVTESVQRIEREVAAYPEVAQAVTRIGRPEAGSHPHPVNFASMQIELAPGAGRGGLRDKRELIAALDRDIRHHPGVQLNFTQPIQNLFDELLSGARTQLAIKLYGEDLEVLENRAAAIEAAIRGIDGLVDLGTEQSFGQPQLQVVPDREACARHGVDVNDIMEMVELAIGGEEVSPLYRGNRRFGIHVRYLADYRERPEVIRDLTVKTASGARLPLSELATIREVVGPVQINREHNQRRWVVSANVRGRDIGSVVADIQRAVEARVTLPPGYFIEYGGQFESQQRAMRRLAVIVPAALGLIFILLYVALGSFRLAALIYFNIPMALIGGVIGLLVMGEYLSVPASVGFIALFGIAVQNGLVLVTYFDQLERQGLPTRRAVLEGAELRLRPVLMTAVTTIAGLLPLLLASGIGSEVQRPLATVVVFGLVSSTCLTLILLPALYDRLATGRSAAARSGS
ncbi:MAG: CusA/CzcA family heavy metal efflux RND transporter, partial [Candidatus Eiseniibacteriota bacterium]|jgi:cobalt-zinc-cadmium resistance protein CzcA